MARNLKRYFVFALSMFVMGFGMAMTTYPNVGTGAMNSLPYEVSIYTFLTVGQAAFALHIIFMAMQYLMTPREVRNTARNFMTLGMQVVTAFLTSVSIDIGMITLRWYYGPEMEGYAARLAMVVAGILLMSVSMAAQLIVSVSFQPAGSFVKVLAEKVGKDFGLIKLLVDIGIVILAVAYGLWASGFTRVISVREGTIIAAVMYGPVVGFLRPRMGFIERFVGK